MTTAPANPSASRSVKCSKWLDSASLVRFLLLWSGTSPGATGRMATTNVMTPTAHNAPNNPAIIDIARGQPLVLMACASATAKAVVELGSIVPRPPLTPTFDVNETS
jgi:hypothetical protein